VFEATRQRLQEESGGAPVTHDEVRQHLKSIKKTAKHGGPPRRGSSTVRPSLKAR